MLRHVCIAALLALVCVAHWTSGPATAHDARPLYIQIDQQSADLFALQVKIPPTLEPFRHPEITLDGCTQVSAAGGSRRSLWSCEGGLSGKQVSFTYPWANPSLSTWVRISWLSGEENRELLTPDVDRWEIPAQNTATSVFLDYIWLGIVHIWLGLDHLLFVAALMLLVKGARSLLITITGFTIAHSITLALSALDLVRVPVAATETVIALSVLFLARELATKSTDTLARRHPEIVSSAFGLLHGFGFAAVLGEIGLPGHALATSLLAFNIGVEIGQIAFIALLLLVFQASRSLANYTAGFPANLYPRLSNLFVYGLGTLSAWWFIDRLTSLL